MNMKYMYVYMFNNQIIYMQYNFLDIIPVFSIIAVHKIMVFCLWFNIFIVYCLDCLDYIFGQSVEGLL